ncbi:MAG TPA: hypothetical protein VJ890_23420 [Vineibacter sp.]|nr:hypothetical protein [Vineibacter sp.]
MAVLRALGWMLLIVTAVVGVYEVADYVDSGDRALSALGELWFKLHAPSLNLTQAIVQRYIHESLWDSAIRPVLLQPALLAFGAAALFCLAVGYLFRRNPDTAAARRRRRRR